MKGTEVAVVKINREVEEDMKVKSSIQGITFLYSFSFERSVFNILDKNSPLNIDLEMEK